MLTHALANKPLRTYVVLLNVVYLNMQHRQYTIRENTETKLVWFKMVAKDRQKLGARAGSCSFTCSKAQKSQHRASKLSDFTAKE